LHVFRSVFRFLCIQLKLREGARGLVSGDGTLGRVDLGLGGVALGSGVALGGVALGSVALGGVGRGEGGGVAGGVGGSGVSAAIGRGGTAVNNKQRNKNNRVEK
jgi:hypothetical protein